MSKNLGITTLTQPMSFYGPSLVLGGGEVKLIDITSAYSVFATQGLKTSPKIILEIKDNTGDDTTPVKIEFTGQQVIIDLFNKNLGAVKAYSEGKIKVIEGSMRSLMKLRSLMF